MLKYAQLSVYIQTCCYTVKEKWCTNQFQIKTPHSVILILEFIT